MITVDYDRLAVSAGVTVLDVGCGKGRHSFEAYRRGAHVTALDLAESDLAEVKDMFGAMAVAGEAPADARAETVHGDLTALPMPTASFDRVIASEVLEHIGDDTAAIGEIARVLRPGGLMAVTVPRWWPERICWALSQEYHEVEGGHVRIYRRRELVGKLRDAGIVVTGVAHAHALHSPYWWLKCAVGVDRDTAATRAYHRMLVWDLMKAPRLTRGLEAALDPVLGKSMVLYGYKRGAGS